MTTSEALRFWAQAYRDGIRITFDGGFVFTKAVHYSQRIETYGQFGVFPTDEIIAPPQWVVNGVNRYADELARLLEQNPPKQFARFFYRLLVLDYEATPIRAKALAAGWDIQPQAVNGGQFLFFVGKTTPREIAVPVAPAILANVKDLQI